MRLRLVQPTKRYASSYLAALRESLPSSANPEALRDQIAHLSDHMRWWRRIASHRKRRDRVHTYWLVDGTQYLGFCQVRLSPSGRHPSIKSHLYYELRPSRRGRGLGGILFAQTLNKARELGLRIVLVACSISNTPSRAIIEEAGGRLVKIVQLRGEPAPILLYRFGRARAAAKPRH